MEKGKSGGHTIWYLLGGGIILYLLFGKNLFAQGGGGGGGIVNSILQKVSVLGAPIYSRTSRISDLTDVPMVFMQAEVQPKPNIIIDFGWRCSRVGNQIINELGIAGTYSGITIGFSPTISFNYNTLASGAYTTPFGFLNAFKFEASKVT